MSRFAGAVALQLIASCGDILPRRSPHLPQDASPDASDDDASPDAGEDAGGKPDAGCALATVTAEVTADAIIGPLSPNLNFGGGPVANVGVGISSLGLFRFDVAALPVDADIRSIQIVFTYAATSTACNTGCATCDTIDATGNVALFYLRPDWGEMTATWNLRASGASWGEAGAALGGVDRSESAIGTARHEATTSTTVEVDADAIADANDFWRVGDDIAFLLAPSAGAVFVIATRESGIEACTPEGYPAALLRIGYCR